MRDSHRAEAEGLLARAVEEEVRRSGGRTDGGVLLSRARGALDAMAETAAEEYAQFTHALDEAEAGQMSFGQRFARGARVDSPAGDGRCRGRRLRGRPAARYGRGDRGRRGRGRRRGGRRHDRREGDGLPCARREPPRRGAEPARRARTAATAVADGAGGAGDPAVPRPAARPRRHRGDRREEADTAAAPYRQERGGQAAQCPGAVLRPTPRARGPVRGPQDADAADRAVGARGAREHRDPAHRRRAARRAGLGPHHARGAGGARAARPVPRRVRGGPAGRRARGPAVDPGRAAASAEPARRAARTAALP